MEDWWLSLKTPRQTMDSEEKRARDLLRGLRFDCSSVNPEIVKGFKVEESVGVEWMPIGRYLLMQDVLKEMSRKGKVSVHPFKFISAVSRMEKIIGIRVCLFQFKSLGWVSLMASESTQRFVCSILSGDGYANVCQFAVESP